MRKSHEVLLVQQSWYKIYNYTKTIQVISSILRIT